MVGLPDGEKNSEDMCNRLGTIPACDRQTDGQTDILSRHSPHYAYASRGKNQFSKTAQSNLDLITLWFKKRANFGGL